MVLGFRGLHFLKFFYFRDQSHSSFFVFFVARSVKNFKGSFFSLLESKLYGIVPFIASLSWCFMSSHLSLFSLSFWLLFLYGHCPRCGQLFCSSYFFLPTVCQLFHFCLGRWSEFVLWLISAILCIFVLVPYNHLQGLERAFSSMWFVAKTIAHLHSSYYYILFLFLSLFLWFHMVHNFKIL